MVKVIKSCIIAQRTNDSSLGFPIGDWETVDRLATEVGYNYLEPKKIDYYSLMHGFFRLMSKGQCSLRNWCVEIGIENNQTVGKSSLHERLGPSTMEMTNKVLSLVMESKLNQARSQSFEPENQSAPLLGQFNKVLLWDSTCCKLPKNLAEHFPSSYSHGEPTATLRIQTAYNYVEKRFEYFEIGSFRNNDQSYANAISKVARAGDLVLRDLGYFTLESFRTMMDFNIFFISKLKPNIYLYHAENGEEIKLLSFLKGKNKVDIPVLLGQKEKLPVRLVAQKLPPDIARQKQEKARADRHKDANHSEEYYELLGWTVFVTNVPVEMLDAWQIGLLYRIRWFIEIVFKAWKSHFNFAKMFEKHKMNYWRAHITIGLALTKVAYWSLNVFQYIKEAVAKITDRAISILKYFDLISQLAERIYSAKRLDDIDPLIPQFARHATYDKRKKRQNFNELYIC